MRPDPPTSNFLLPLPAQRGPKVVAVVLILISLLKVLGDPTDVGLVNSWIEAFQSDAILAMLRYASAVAGIGTGMGLLSGKRWWVWLYVVWFALLLAALVVAQARVEPDVLKVIAVAGLASILPVGGFIYLRHA